MPRSGKVVDPCGAYSVLFPITYKQGRIVYLCHYGGIGFGIVYQVYRGQDQTYNGQTGFDAIISSVSLAGATYTPVGNISRYIQFYSVGW